jgi:hypothetical protein
MVTFIPVVAPVCLLLVLVLCFFDGGHELVSYVLMCDDTYYCILYSCVYFMMANTCNAYLAMIITEYFVKDPQYFCVFAVFTCSIYIYNQDDYIYEYSVPYINI